MLKLILNNLERPLVWCSSLASIASLVLMALRDTTATIIALCMLCLSLGIALVAILRAINRYVKIYNGGSVRRIATFIDYKTLDAQRIEFQTYRIVQVKSIFLRDYEIAYN